MTLRRFLSSWAAWRRSMSGSRGVFSRFAQKGAATSRTPPGGCVGGVAVQDRGETLTAIAELAGVKVSEVHAALK
jgi:hypothetical protein